MMQLLTCFGLALCKGGVQVNMAQAVLGDKSVTGRSGVWVLDPASAMGVDLTSILGVVLTSIVGVDLASRVRVVLTSRVGVDLTSTVGVVMTSMVGVDMTSKVGMDLTSTGDGICINSSSWVRSLSTGLLTLEDEECILRHFKTFKIFINFGQSFCVTENNYIKKCFEKGNGV